MNAARGDACSAVDLHLHSTASDGVLAPAALVAHVAACGVRLFALTDHDTVDGLGEAATAARRLGLEFVPGTELSAGWRGRTVHVVGLGIDPSAPALAAALALRQELRAHRAQRIRERLDRCGAPGSAAYARLAAAGTRVATRTHFARALAELGAAPDAGHAFERWLGRGRAAHVTADWPDLAAAIDAIVAAGGHAVLAHPLRYALAAGARRELAAEFRAAGGSALEVAIGGASRQQVEAATGLALRAGLEGSVGSDCHDPALPWHRPGRLAKLSGFLVPVWHRWESSLHAAEA